MTRLAAGGITAVTVEFDGKGGSGQLEPATAHAGEAEVTLPTTPVTLYLCRQAQHPS
jgi:hypothetical protein